MTPGALFLPDGDGFRATELTQGPWSREHQHGGAVSALLALTVERVPTLVPMRTGRLTVELVRPVPVDRLTTTARVVREGKRIQLVEAVLVHAGTEVARATALRVRIGASAAAVDHPRRPLVVPPPRPPEPGKESLLKTAGLPVPGYLRAVEMDKVLGGVGTGTPALTWFRLTVPVAAGHALTPFQRLAALADFASGTGNFLEIDRWSSINADITLHVLREPVGEWIAVSGLTWVGAHGIGHGRAVLHDTESLIGHATAGQIVAPR